MKAHESGTILFLCSKVLLASGANVNAIDDDGLTPLMYAAERNRRAILKALIRRGKIIQTYE